MKKRVFCLLAFVVAVILGGCGTAADQTSDITNTTTAEQTASETESHTSEKTEWTMNIQVGEHLLTATLVENSSTEALLKILEDGPLTINMSDYSNMEKVGALPESLPRNDEQISTEAGDLILYQGNAFVIYYDTNSWDFTRLGRINHITQQELKEILGSGDVTVVLSISKQEKDGSSLQLSERFITIREDGNEAVFQLYDTLASEKLYEQLPLTLDTENFRNAQWMFYPPERLPVSSEEAYHDGVKGELSYYEPWGDAFILYEDFYAGDEMHHLGICKSGIEYLEDFNGTITVERLESTAESQEDKKMEKQMHLTVDGHEIVFALNDSTAANSLYEQLPLQAKVSDYSSEEKIFYPTEGLDTSDTPLANAKNGTLAYFSPWGDVVMYYKDFGSYNGLYELGQVVSGGEYIQSIPKGTYTFEK